MESQIVNYGKELTRNFNQKKNSDILQQLIDVQPVTNVVGESIFAITMWIIVNQIGKHDFSCGSLVNNLKDKELFSDQINRNRFNPIFTRHDWNCSTM